MAGFMGWRAGGHPFKLSFPLRGNGLCKPLDSGLRRNDEMLVETSVVISACSRQAAMMIKQRLPRCFYHSVVIPAKAGIQEGEAGG